jgi:biopolymer transport protein ExbB/TolQ
MPARRPQTGVETLQRGPAAGPGGLASGLFNESPGSGANRPWEEPEMLRKGMTVLAFLVAVTVTSVFYGALYYTAPRSANPDVKPPESPIYSFFCQRGWYQHASVLMFFYGLLLVAARSWSCRQESRALNISPPAKMIRPEDAAPLVERISSKYGRTLVGRRLAALLRGYSRMEEVGPLLDRLAENDRQELERNSSLLSWVRGLPPVFGLLGTLDGLRGGTAQISSINAADLMKVKEALQSFARNSSTAFDTTLLGISCALIVSAAIFLLRKSEDDLLGRIGEIAHSVGSRFVRNSRADEETQGFLDRLEKALAGATHQVLSAFQQEMRNGISTTVQGWLDAWKKELSEATRRVLEQLRERGGENPEALLESMRAAVGRLEAIERALARPRAVQLKISAEPDGKELTHEVRAC